MAHTESEHRAEGEYRLYRELAQWWPLISPPEQYADEAAYLAAILGRPQAGRPVREVLDLGSGGGHVAVHLAGQFSLTLVDLSDDMLTVSRRLNPRCPHLQGDMRTIRLGRSFDAVLVHDAVDYITTQADLRQVIETAFAHCRPGGIAAFVPDYVKDSFRELAGSGGGGQDETGRQATFREHTWDPDRGDDWVQADYEFILRQADGTVELIRETHRLGAFSSDTWTRLIGESGFEPEPDPEAGLTPAGQAGAAVEAGAGQRARMPGQPPANLFVGRRGV